MVLRLIGITLGLFLAYAVTKAYVNPDFDLKTLLAAYTER